MSGAPLPVRLASADLTAQPHLNECREREARRIAQLLHDDAGQLLSAVHFKIDQLAAELPSHHGGLQEIKSMIEQVASSIRRLSHELRPSILDNLGLIPAIEFLADGVATRTGLTISVEGSTGGRLPPMVETVLYRNVQEALSNAGKHARAKRVYIRLWRDTHIHCSILDNGVGASVADIFAPRKKCGLGLIGIRERTESLGGTVSTNSERGKGFDIVVTIPLERAEAAATA